jgi:Nuclear condensing complex subunits, C-term domain
MVKFDAAAKESQQMGYLVTIIQNMNSESDVVKMHAIVGACQLMLSGRISSSHLLAKVILLWFLPSSSNVALLEPFHAYLNCMLQATAITW